MVKKKRKIAKETEVSLIDFEQMPNSEKFTNEVKVLCSAACGVIVVRTRELHRCATTLFEFAVAKQTTKFRSWMITNGWREMNTQPSNGGFSASTLVNSFKQDAEATQVEEEYFVDLYPENDDGDGSLQPEMGMEKYFEYVRDDVPTGEGGNGKSGVYVMFAPDSAFEGPGFQEFVRRAATVAVDKDVRLFMIVHDSAEIPERMFEEVKIVDFDAPNARELYEELENTLGSLQIEGSADDAELDLPEAAKQKIVRNALGLSMMDFSNAISIAFVRQEDELKEGDDLDPEVFVKTVLDTKLELIRKNPILEYVPSIPIGEVGGLDLLKLWLHRRKKAFSPEARAFGVDMPKGILAAGVPGSGKSLIAKAFSSVLGIPCVSLDIGKVFGSLVGQSESQMRTALKVVEAMSPVVLLIDEIDKGFANTSGGGDSGTTARVFGTFLTWLQERNSSDRPVVAVFTANNVDGLPPELTRKGRVDELFCVSFPSPSERKDIFAIHLHKRGHEIDDAILTVAAKHTKDFVGAEIEAVVQEAILTAFEADAETVTEEHLIAAANGTKTMKSIYPERVNRMNTWAKTNAKPASSFYDFDERLDEPESAKASSRSPSRRRFTAKKSRDN